ncbi:MAG: hypothetical protein JWP97_4955 [Labilithrix sp.]|nr:hypothetical protein [Labilithrix sp.]
MKAFRLLAGAALAAFALAVPSRADAAHGENSFTPTALEVPLHGVRLGGADPSRDTMLYRCAADAAGDMPDAGPPTSTAAACLVDMANDAALAALFTAPVAVAPGTYDHVTFDTCDRGASSYTVLVSGVVDLAGSTYHTTAGDDGFLSLDASLAGPAPLAFAGCSTTLPLPGPVTIADGDEVVISSFFSLANIAWGALNPNSMGGCASSGARSVCSAIPVPVTYLGKTTPTLETYTITEDLLDLDAAKGAGQILLLRDVAGEPFGGFSRRLYSPLSGMSHVNYDTPLKEVVRNAGDAPTYTITNWGGGSPGGEPSPYYVKFVAFELGTHEGQMLGPSSPDFIAYRAVKQ